MLSGISILVAASAKESWHSIGRVSFPFLKLHALIELQKKIQICAFFAFLQHGYLKFVIEGSPSPNYFSSIHFDFMFSPTMYSTIIVHYIVFHSLQQNLRSHLMSAWHFQDLSGLLESRQAKGRTRFIGEKGGCFWRFFSIGFLKSRVEGKFLRGK